MDSTRTNELESQSHAKTDTGETWFIWSSSVPYVPVQTAALWNSKEAAWHT
jgi:hypothetical protein